MATATSGEQQITIDGQKYLVRTQVVYQDGLGTGGTLSTSAPIRYVAQYKPGPTLLNPIPDWINLGERDVNSKNNWTFTNSAGSGFRLKLAENGPTSLTNSLDRATSNALSKSSGVTLQQATNILQTAPNAAPTVVDPDQGTVLGSSSPDSTSTSTTNDPLQSSAIDTTISDSETSIAVDESLRGVSLVYPSSIRGTDQDRIKFTALAVGPRKDISITKDNISSGKFSLGTRVTESLGSVVLPIQPSITDSNGVDWGGANLNPIQAYAASLSLGIASAGGNITGEVANALNQAATVFKDNLKDYSKAMQIYFAQEAVGAQGLLSRTSGAILNPNLELLFNGPTLRPFNFTFRLSPRDKDEAREVKAIINFFKKSMAVKKAASEVFLKSPNVFKIEYQTANSEHQSLNKIKDCALLGCDVDYTPDGSYMTFNDEGKTMTSYQLTLRFSELDPIYNTDYADHPIGY